MAQTPQVSYLTADHLGSPRVITDQNGAVTTRKDYAAFGDETFTAQRTSNLKYDSSETRKGYTGYEKDGESGLDFAQARYYNSIHGRFTSIDPLTASATIKNPQTFNRYSYVLNSPYKFGDPLGLISQGTGADGGCDFKCRAMRTAGSGVPLEKSGLSANDIARLQYHIANGTALGYSYQNAARSRLTVEPVRDQAGTIGGFVQSMNNSPSKIGTQKGEEAKRALKRLGETEGIIIPTPKTTPYFNLDKNRYIYTEKGGWIDMVHFLFYAGRAYQNKEKGNENPIGDAVQEGYWQERVDGTHSAYSYEDLPSDKFGADFGGRAFDSSLNKSLGEQIEDYINTLGPTDPKNAPNWSEVPDTDDDKSAPTKINKTTTPVFTKP